MFIVPLGKKPSCWTDFDNCLTVKRVEQKLTEANYVNWISYTLPYLPKWDLHQK